MSRRIESRRVVGHVDVAARVIELVEPDGLEPDSSHTHADPSSAGKKEVEYANISHEKRRDEPDNRGERPHQCPQRQHENGADHFAAALVSAFAAFTERLSASPFSHAVR